MLAFVLSGGGNYGALQAGALAVLLEHGIRPDLLVGVSAGALNAAFLATDPTAAGAQRLAEIWRDHAPHAFSPPHSLSVLLQLARDRDSLLLNEPLQQFIQRWIPAGATFGAFVWPRLYLTATRLVDGGLRVFGDDPDEQVFDGLMASTALLPLFPPWEVDGEAYVDGGVVADLPLQVAVACGTDEIFALQIAQSSLPSNHAVPHGMLAIAGKVLATMIDRTNDGEIQAVQDRRDVRLHLIRLWTPAALGFWDFNHGQALVADGRRLAERYLADMPGPQPWYLRGQDWLRHLPGRDQVAPMRDAISR